MLIKQVRYRVICRRGRELSRFRAFLFHSGCYRGKLRKPGPIHCWLGTGVDAATKFAQDDGKFSDYIDVENLDVRDRALDKAFRLHGAYAPKDPKEAAQFGVKVVIIDVPRPQHGVWMPDVGPGAIVQRVFSVVNGSQTIGVCAR